jgi:hypothetical protein
MFTARYELSHNMTQILLVFEGFTITCIVSYLLVVLMYIHRKTDEYTNNLGQKGTCAL